MRTFIALEFNQNLKQKLGQIQRVLKKHSLKGRWTYINNLHLTLKFLGNIDPNQVNTIKSNLGDIARNNRKMNLSINHLGYFPGKDILRVVWLGIEGDIEPLEKLNNEVEWQMKALGFPKERRKFSPHITLGRYVTFNTKIFELNDRLKKDMDYSFTLDTIKFVKSEEIEGKRIYTSLGSFKLK